MADRIQENIQSGFKGDKRDRRITWQDFKGFMKLILAQTFSEKIDVFFEVFDLDKNSCFSREEVYKICNSCLAQMFTTPIVNLNNEENIKKEDDFLHSLTEYFTQYIFETCGYKMDEEIPFDLMRDTIKNSDGEETQLLRLFCGVDQFADPIQEYTHKKVVLGEL